MTDKTINDLRTGKVYKPKQKYKVALCLSGKLRNFRHTAEFFNRYVIKPLKADVFFYGSNSALAETDEQDLVQLLKPKKYTIHKEHLYVNPEFNKYKRPEVNPTSIVYQAFNILRCNYLKNEYAEETDTKYDIVIRCRTDCFFTRSFSEKELNNAVSGNVLIPSCWHFKDVNSFCVSDMFAMSNSDTMNIYSELYNCLNSYIGKCIIHPESLMGHHLINVNQFDIVDINKSPFVFEYPVDWKIPEGYNRETYRQSF